MQVNRINLSPLRARQISNLSAQGLEKPQKRLIVTRNGTNVKRIKEVTHYVGKFERHLSFINDNRRVLFDDPHDGGGVKAVPQG